MPSFDRETAKNLLLEHVTTPHIIPHSYAVEAIMRELAEEFAPQEKEKWAIAGLLHDFDYDLVDWKSDHSLHGPKTVEILKEVGFGDEDIYNAILAHNPTNGSKITNNFERCIYAADPMSGFITATAKVYPDKKVTSVKVKSILKRMKEERFASGINREGMRSIEKLGMSFEDFAERSLKAMSEISGEIGL